MRARARVRACACTSLPISLLPSHSLFHAHTDTLIPFKNQHKKKYIHFFSHAKSHRNMSAASPCATYLAGEATRITVSFFAAALHNVAGCQGGFRAHTLWRRDMPRPFPSH